MEKLEPKISLDEASKLFKDWDASHEASVYTGFTPDMEYHLTGEVDTPTTKINGKEYPVLCVCTEEGKSIPVSLLRKKIYVKSDNTTFERNSEFSSEETYENIGKALKKDMALKCNAIYFNKVRRNGEIGSSCAVGFTIQK